MTITIKNEPEGGFLGGQLLIANPSLSDGCFDRSVIFICEHDENGALGVVINQPIANIRLGEILEVLNIVGKEKVPDLPVYFGGPVDAHRGLVLHTGDKLLEDSVLSSQGIALTANANMLKIMASGAGPQEAFLLMGYSGWAASQLEQEIEQGSWIVAPATKKLVFETENDMKWSMAADSLGVDISRLSGTVGHA